MSSDHVDQFIARFSPEQQAILQQIRQTIAKAVPDATEEIGYGIAGFKLNGWLVHYSAFKNHYSLFGGGHIDALQAKFSKQLAKYTTSKGTIQFPYDAPVPVTLIREIALFRAAQNLAKKS